MTTILAVALVPWWLCSATGFALFTLAHLPWAVTA